MKPIDRYGLEPHAGPYASWPTTSVLRVDGKQTPTRVPGFVIEAQYAASIGDVLITSFDCPFEESNAFVLLDEAHSIIAQASLIVPYASFLLHEHWVIDDWTLGLHYHEGLFYTLRVIPRGSWLRTTPELRLQRQTAWRRDARMVEAYDRLKESSSDVPTAE